MEERKDWIAVNIDHERYCFDFTMHLYQNKTLQEVCDEHWFVNIDYLEKRYEDEEIYEWDGCRISDIDTKYTYPDLDGTKLRHIHMDYYLIFPLEYLWKDGYIGSVFGSTNSKFGVLDIKREEEK